MLVASSDSPGAVYPTPAFVHRVTGDVLTVKEGDEVARQHFPDLLHRRTARHRVAFRGVARGAEA